MIYCITTVSKFNLLWMFKSSRFYTTTTKVCEHLNIMWLFNIRFRNHRLQSACSTFLGKFSTTFRSLASGISLIRQFGRISIREVGRWCWEGQSCVQAKSSSSTTNWENNFFMDLALCTEAMSCQNRKEPQSGRYGISKISLHTVAVFSPNWSKSTGRIWHVIIVDDCHYILLWRVVIHICCLFFPAISLNTELPGNTRWTGKSWR